MKTTTIILLASLLLCGCSRKPKDFIQTGRDITCNRGLCVLHVDKRDGDSVFGIHCVVDPGRKTEHIVTADTGTIKPLFTNDNHVVLVELVLHSWKDQNGTHEGHDTSMALRQ
jgi:hypothetical protein